jgi:hypothetical protein
MIYTQLTTKELIAQQRAFIRELEAKHHSLEQQAAMNRRLMQYYKGEKNKVGQENARQQVARDEAGALEIKIGLPVLAEHLQELIDLDIAAEDAVEEADASARATEPAANLGDLA